MQLGGDDEDNNNLTVYIWQFDYVGKYPLELFELPLEKKSSLVGVCNFQVSVVITNKATT